MRRVRECLRLVLVSNEFSGRKPLSVRGPIVHAPYTRKAGCSPQFAPTKCDVLLICKIVCLSHAKGVKNATDKQEDYRSLL